MISLFGVLLCFTIVSSALPQTKVLPQPQILKYEKSLLGTKLVELPTVWGKHHHVVHKSPRHRYVLSFGGEYSHYGYHFNQYLHDNEDHDRITCKYHVYKHHTKVACR